MKTLSDIEEILFKEKIFLEENFSVKRIGIFGSYLQGKIRKSSDIDLLVEFIETPDFIRYMQLEKYLQKKLGRKVDLVMKSALKPVIGKEILREVRYL